MAETKNYHTIGYGTKDGELKFGHIHNDGVVSSTILRSGHEANHYITLDSTGGATRKHGTISRCTGSYQVIAGDNVPDEVPAVYIDAINGDLVLNAKNGRIRLLAENIDIIADGPDGKNGVVYIEGNEKIILKSPTIDIRSTISTKIFSEKTVDVIGKAILNIYGGLIDAADGATKINGSKPCSGPYTNEEQNKK
jgi:hypothetical protein